MYYSQLQTTTNFSFLKGASHPRELVECAYLLGYYAIAITDECSLAGIVKAHTAAKSLGIKLIAGSTFLLSNGCRIVVIASDRQAYSELSGFITLTRRRSPKGEYTAHFDDLRFRLQNCLIIWLADQSSSEKDHHAAAFYQAFKQRLWLGIDHQLTGGEQKNFSQWAALSEQWQIPMLACSNALMHDKSRKPLQDTLTAIRENCTLDALGSKLNSNAEAYLKPLTAIENLYPPEMIAETQVIAERCDFSLDELRYQYPPELVPKNTRPIDHLSTLVYDGAKKRWPEKLPEKSRALIERELELIEEMHYEYYFLTVYDIVCFARRQNILCQGRGSAANSVVCYCLFITEISPDQINVLFERFISKERDEPPDIDVDFEHQRREEVIQYIYQKYGRERAALAATVITYRSRSAIRDVGKALGLEPALIEHFAKSLAWWDRSNELEQRITESGVNGNDHLMKLFFSLVDQILGFPRHLSQHVGGFIITQDKISDLVPLENASMPERTIIQWDKEDLEAMGLLKVDVLALGMLTALRKCLEYVHHYKPAIKSVADIPREDPDTYAMLSRADSIGVFQVESRAQMSMLPRLKPCCFYDLVIEIAIIRPGPIQGDMVHPYLRRRDGEEAVSYHNDAIRKVLSPTLGIPIFQEQAIRLAMVAAGFSGGQADQLRRAMASWGKNSNLLSFETQFVTGMLNNGYSETYARQLFSQIKGFGGYGFPESHSASFAILCYFSSWLKCHHPAAFYCALLNSQPMGFYSPSQLIQDARRHNIKVLPVDVNASEIENRLEQRPATSGTCTTDWAIRLGLERVRGLEHSKAQKLVDARKQHPFTSINDLAQRSTLSHRDLALLAAADAMHKLSGNRYQSHWQAAATDAHNDLLNTAKPAPEKDPLTTMPPSLANDIYEDYDSIGLSLRPHPMVLLRDTPPFNRCSRQNQLHAIGNGRFVQVAGVVTGRQRPGTAKGTIFLTLEDETGNMNVVVWKATQTHYRKALLQATLLVVKGRLESKHGVTHIIAGKLEDHSHALHKLNPSSRDFH